MVTIKSHTFFSAPLLSTPSSHWWSKIIQKIPTAWSFPNIVLGLLISLSKKWEMNICHKGFFMLRHFFVTKQLINGLVSLFLMDFRWEQTPKKLRHKSVTLLRSPGVQHPLILTHWCAVLKLRNYLFWKLACWSPPKTIFCLISIENWDWQTIGKSRFLLSRICINFSSFSIFCFNFDIFLAKPQKKT